MPGLAAPLGSCIWHALAYSCPLRSGMQGSQWQSYHVAALLQYVLERVGGCILLYFHWPLWVPCPRSCRSSTHSCAQACIVQRTPHDRTTGAVQQVPKKVAAGSRQHGLHLHHCLRCHAGATKLAGGLCAICAFKAPPLSNRAPRHQCMPM